MVQAILRYYSYGFQLLVSLILLALGAVATLSDNKSFAIDLLPWADQELRYALLILGAFGLLSTILAIKGKSALLFVLWTLGTAFLLARGVFASGHVFEGESDFKWALFLLSGVFATVLGAWSRFRQPASR